MQFHRIMTYRIVDNPKWWVFFFPGSSASSLCGFITKSRKYNFQFYTVASDKMQQSLQFSPALSTFNAILSITVYIVVSPVVTDRVFLCSKCHIWDCSANPFDSKWRTLFSVIVFDRITCIARPGFDSLGVQGSAFFINTVDSPAGETPGGQILTLC